MADLSPQEARLSELLRVVAQAGDDVLAYLDERLEQLYPEEYKAYRRRWQALREKEGRKKSQHFSTIGRQAPPILRGRHRAPSNPTPIF